MPFGKSREEYLREGREKYAAGDPMYIKGQTVQFRRMAPGATKALKHLGKLRDVVKVYIEGWLEHGDRERALKAAGEMAKREFGVDFEARDPGKDARLPVVDGRTRRFEVKKLTLVAGEKYPQDAYGGWKVLGRRDDAPLQERFRWSLEWAMEHAGVQGIQMGEVPDPLCQRHWEMEQVKPSDFSRLVEKYVVPVLESNPADDQKVLDLIETLREQGPPPVMGVEKVIEQKMEEFGEYRPEWEVRAAAKLKAQQEAEGAAAPAEVAGGTPVQAN